eukprot:231459-Rhodomonas_salina.3
MLAPLPGNSQPTIAVRQRPGGTDLHHFKLTRIGDVRVTRRAYGFKNTWHNLSVQRDPAHFALNASSEQAHAAAREPDRDRGEAQIGFNVARKLPGARRPDSESARPVPDHLTLRSNCIPDSIPPPAGNMHAIMAWLSSPPQL